MSAHVIVQDRQIELDSAHATILDALKHAGVTVSAPCGGAGTCGKCWVLVQQQGEKRWVLACQTQLEDDMLVRLDEPDDMRVELGGAADAAHARFEADRKAGVGLAIDIGTTTLAARLVDLTDGRVLASCGRPNPQASYGADVISRIQASVEGKLDDMCGLVQDAFMDMCDDMCANAGLSPQDVSAAAFAGNTVMEHIAARLAPDSIGVVPFEPLTRFGDEHCLGPVSDNAYFAPCVSGYVGGDITAGMLACGLDETQRTVLYLDLGTNGELALVHDGTITCCATAAGPVFEGAGLSCGMSAVDGAISGVSVSCDDVQVETIGNREACGIAGSGIIDAVAAMLELEVIDETGLMFDADELEGALSERIVEIDDANAFVLASGEKPVVVTQKDVRSVQLAKAAICAGMDTLLAAKNISPDDVDELVIAGGFGKHVNIESAARIGLFPEELSGRTSSVGNMSMEGAQLLVVSLRAQRACEQLAQDCTYIELSTDPSFNDFYMDRMFF